MKRLSWGFAGGNGLLHGLVLGGGDTQWKLTRSPQAYPATTVGIQKGFRQSGHLNFRKARLAAMWQVAASR